MNNEDKVRYIELKLMDIKKAIEDKDKEIERLHSIIKEVREILESKKHCERLFGGVEGKSFIEQALEILDKVDKDV